MAVEYFCCYHSYRRSCEKLTDQELGRLFRSLLEYSETGETQELAGRESIAFDFIAADIDRAKEAYEAKCKSAAENGRKGGRPQKSDGFSEKPKKADGFFENPKKLNKEKEEEKEEGKEDSYNPQTPFGRFWDAYPKKVGKIDAERAFKKVKVPIDKLLSAIETQKRSDQWQKQGGQFIPNPATWLNQGRWDDQVEPCQVNNTSQMGDMELEAIKRMMSDEKW